VKKVLIITTGGTIFQRAVNGKMEICVSPEEILSELDVNCKVSVKQIGKRAGADITFMTLMEIADHIRESDHIFDGFVVVTGTDSMEEVAYFLDRVISVPHPIAICGSMKPNDIVATDGPANLLDAVKVVLNKEASGLGVLVVMNDNIHLAKYVRKRDSALIGSFESMPGSIGQLRCGEPIFYYSAPTKTRPTIENFNPKIAAKAKIPIWTMAIMNEIPEDLLKGVDGLVIAGMGTGSISRKMIDLLAPKWTQRMPIVLSTRCWEGLSYDDYYYKGSKTKYQDMGFLIDSYSDLNPLQVRLELIFQKSADLRV